MPKSLSKSTIFKCMRKKENYIYGTNRKKPDKFNAPKVTALIEKIKELDRLDEEVYKKKFKHFIYSEMKYPAGITLIAEALEMNGFDCALQKQGSKLVLNKTDITRKQNAFGVLFKQTFKGVSNGITTALKKEMMDTFNHPKNNHGDDIRFMLLEKEFKEGIDIFDVKYAHILEDTMTSADLTQIIGRGTRQCGQKNLPLYFVPNVGWTLNVYRYVLKIPDNLKQKYPTSLTNRSELNSINLFDVDTLKDIYTNFSSLDSNEINFINQLNILGPYLGVDYYLTKPIHKDFDYTQDPFNLIDDSSIEDSKVNDIIERQYSFYTTAGEKREEERFIAEQRKIEDDRKKAEDKRLADEQRREEQRIRLGQEHQKSEEKRIAQEQRLEQERIRKEEQRIEEELRKGREIIAEREARLEDQRQKKLLEDKTKQEAIEKEEKRLAQLLNDKKISQMEEEKRASLILEKERRLEEERLEAQRRQQEEERRIEKARQDAEDKERMNRERIEQERIRAEEKRKEQERILEDNRRREEERKESERKRIEEQKRIEDERRREEEQRIQKAREEAEERERQRIIEDEKQRQIREDQMKQNRLKRLEQSGISQSNIISDDEKRKTKLREEEERQRIINKLDRAGIKQSNIIETNERGLRRRSDGGGVFQTLQDLHKFIYMNYGQWKWTKKFTPDCDSKDSKLNPSQKFIKHYFTPQLSEKGMLLWHSVGSGKTCTAISAASAEFEEQGYKIVWVTRGQLKSTVSKNIFGDVVCHQRVKKGSARYKSKTLDNKIWSQPISHRQLSNICKSTKATTLDVSIKLYDNKKKHSDLLYKTLIIIDEAHFLYGKAGGLPQELPETKYIEEALNNSYLRSGENSAKVLLLTATPITEKPDEFMKLINLCKTPSQKMNIPSVFETIQMNGWSDFINKHLSGYISYVNRMYDPSQFAQFKIEDVPVNMTTLTNKNDTNNQEYAIMTNCFDVKEKHLIDDIAYKEKITKESPFHRITRLSPSQQKRSSPKYLPAIPSTISTSTTTTTTDDKIQYFMKVKENAPEIFNDFIGIIKSTLAKENVMDEDDIAKLQKLFRNNYSLLLEFNTYLPANKQIPTKQPFRFFGWDGNEATKDNQFTRIRTLNSRKHKKKKTNALYEHYTNSNKSNIPG